MPATTEPTQNLALWVQIITSIFGTLATLAAVVVALFIEPIKAAWFGPNLVLKLVDRDGHLLKFTSGKPQLFYHLKVENQKRFRLPIITARNCRVVVRDVQIKHGSGNFVTINVPAPMQLRWPGWMPPKDNPAPPPPQMDVNNSETVDFASLDVDGFWLETYFTPSSKPFKLKKDETAKIVLELVAENFTPKRFHTIEVFWDGKWNESPEIVREQKHLTMKLD